MATVWLLISVHSLLRDQRPCRKIRVKALMLDWTSDRLSPPGNRKTIKPSLGLIVFLWWMWWGKSKRMAKMYKIFIKHIHLFFVFAYMHILNLFTAYSFFCTEHLLSLTYIFGRINEVQWTYTVGEAVYVELIKAHRLAIYSLCQQSINWIPSHVLPLDNVEITALCYDGKLFRLPQSFINL